MSSFDFNSVNTVYLHDDGSLVDRSNVESFFLAEAARHVEVTGQPLLLTRYRPEQPAVRNFRRTSTESLSDSDISEQLSDTNDSDEEVPVFSDDEPMEYYDEEASVPSDDVFMEFYEEEAPVFSDDENMELDVSENETQCGLYSVDYGDGSIHEVDPESLDQDSGYWTVHEQPSSAPDLYFDDLESDFVGANESVGGSSDSDYSL